MFPKRQKIISLFLLFSFLFLQGCATFFAKETKMGEGNHYLTWNKRQQQLQAVNNWDLNGVMSVNYQGKNDIVNFAWNQVASNYSIDFHGPLHLGGAKIIGNDRKVDLIKGANDVVEANSPEDLMLSQFGWYLPLSDMVYWVRALPAPDSAIKSASFDEYHHLILLKQQGWQIRYADFKSIKSVDLPTKIYLNSESVQVKLVFKWVSV